jgi:CheW-like domain
MAQDPIHILKERARALSQKGDPAVTGDASLTLFKRAHQMYGVRPQDVESAGRLRHMSPIPAAPSWMVGAVQHQGMVLTLIDLPAFWGHELEGIADLPTYIVLTDGQRRVGILVEELRGDEVQFDGAPVPYRGPDRSGVTAVAWGHYPPAPGEAAPEDAARRKVSVLVVSGAELLRDSRLKP